MPNKSSNRTVSPPVLSALSEIIMDWKKESLSDFLRNRFLWSLDFWLISIWSLIYMLFLVAAYLIPGGILPNQQSLMSVVVVFVIWPFFLFLVYCWVGVSNNFKFTMFSLVAIMAVGLVPFFVVYG